MQYYRADMLYIVRQLKFNNSNIPGRYPILKFVTLSTSGI